MKNRGLLFLVGLILSLVVNVQGQCTEDKYEPNNSIVQAIPNVLNGSLAVCTVGTNGGDWFGPYYVLIGQTATVRADFNQSEGNLDLILTRFDASTLASSQSTTRPFEEVTITGASELTHFWVNLILRSDAGLPGMTYSYRVTLGPNPPCPDDPYEPSDNVNQAFPSPTTAVACISDPDYYGPIDLTPGQTLSVSLLTQGSQDSLVMVLVSDKNQSLTNSTKIVGSGFISYTSSTQQSAFLVVSYSSSETGNPGAVYTIDWSISEPECADNDYYEPNSILQIPGSLPGGAVNLIVCLESPDFFGPVTLHKNESISVQLSFSSADKLDVKLSDTIGTSVVPTTHSTTSGQALLTYVHTQSNPITLVVEVYIISNPSTLGARYSIFTTVAKSCSGINCPSGEECKNGECVCLYGADRNPDQTCPDLCAGIVCPTGEECRGGVCECITGTRGSDGICTADPCAHLVCPTGEHCSNGTCVCNNGNRDASGVCVVDLCAGVNCPTGEHCLNGTCVCNNGTRNASGVCVVDPCSGVNCPTGEHCSNGTCVCNNGTRNASGVCVVDSCSGVNCPTGEHCSNGTCVCNNGTRNASGVCVVDLCAGVKCPSNENCVNGTCVCNTGYVRTNGTCQPISNCTGVTCPAHSSCQNGFCVCNPGYSNSSGGSSVNSTGTCNSIPCYNFTCPSHASCRENQCFCDSGYKNAQNGGDQVSQNGTCAQDKCSLVECTENSNCQDGVCVCNKGYIQNSAGHCILDPCLSVVCSDPVATCYNGVCFCPPSYEQQGEKCVQLPPDACTLANCSAKGALCDASTGQCYCDANFVLSTTTGKCEYPTNDLCTFVSCPSNSYCHDGLCYCQTGYMDRMGQCMAANLAGCSEYRGFTDELTVELLSQVALQNVNSQLAHLQSDLEWIVSSLPEWEQNECCSSDPYMYPFDMVEIAEASWAFLADPQCSLDRYNEASQQYFQDLKY